MFISLLVLTSALTMELCARCGKSQDDFKGSKKAFKQHFKNKDHSDESYSCKKCDKFFPNMRGLQVHFNSVHDSTVTFECDVHGEHIFKGINHVNSYNLS